MTQNVLTLKENYQAMKDPVFGNILKNLRTGNLSDRGAKHLMGQCLLLRNNDVREKMEMTLERCGCTPVRSKMRKIKNSS